MYQETVSLTRKMKSTRSNIYRHLLTRKDFDSKLLRLENAQPSQFPTICAEICDMFSALGITCEIRRDVSYYEGLISKLDFPEFSDIEEQILKIMYDCFGNYPTPEQYMLRIVNRLSNPDDNWQNDSLRLRILKQFIKYGNCLTYVAEGRKVNVYGGEAYLKKYAKSKSGKAVKSIEDLLYNIDESVFDVLGTASKAQKKSDGTYGLLKVADDLAHGVFKAGGATKRDLYMFAFVFEMTYTIDGEVSAMKTTEMIDYESDIEKNLFEDYYTNNLMRFITKAYEGDKSAFEMDPSGRGINYKNFAEMVYIYYISKDYEPIEKIRRATEMIERLKSSAGSRQIDVASTQYYITLFTEDILKMNEAEFEMFIAANYDCDVEFEDVDKKGEKYTGKKAALQLQTTQGTAFYVYQRLIEQMEANRPNDPALLRENCNYGLWFVDVSGIEKYGTHRIEEILLRADSDKENNDSSNVKRNDSKKIKDFVKLLYGINMFLGHLFVENESGLLEEQEHTALSKRVIKKMSINKAEDMTRTALIVAFYYRYNQLNENRGSIKSFVDVMDDYTDYTTGLNSMLEASGYQPINDRNIFDLAVIFSSYAYLSM